MEGGEGGDDLSVEIDGWERVVMGRKVREGWYSKWGEEKLDWEFDEVGRIEMKCFVSNNGDRLEGDSEDEYVFKD
ncbi:hypothetical protein Tco_0218427 [Tanacetum coccineum]